MGFSFIVFGIRIIYIKREKEREGKTMTWKKGSVYRNVLLADSKIIF